ncbi:hypothetical protein [Embleya sp. NPDC059237]|uniref:hypothetical protein n=1 Tax=Embleya sp. NPDC059237 TaxID=3346784 RepID=UPI0036AD14FB
MTDEPADTIRRAAEHLRALAAAASAPPWAVRPRWADDPTGSADVTDGSGGTLVHGRSGTRGRAPFLRGPDARYVAAMGPAVGLALATWLDECATQAATGSVDEPGAVAAALTIARTILGGQP